MPKVLVIDDDAEVRVLICAMLQRGAGWQTVEASTGPVGIAAFQKGDIDAVVTDLIMPAPTGVEIIKRLRAIDPHVPIIAVSGFGWDDTSPLIREALDAGANGTLGKPFRPDELIQMIRRYSPPPADSKQTP